MSKPQLGAALIYFQKIFGGVLGYNTAEYAISTTTALKIVTLNPDRLGLVVIVFGANNCYVSPLQSDVIVPQGIYLAASGGNVTMDFVHDLFMPTLEWWALAVTGASTIWTLEMFKQG